METNNKNAGMEKDTDYLDHPDSEVKQKEITDALEKLKEKWNRHVTDKEFSGIRINEEELASRLHNHIINNYSSFFRLYRQIFISNMIAVPLVILFIAIFTPYNIWMVSAITSLLMGIYIYWDIYAFIFLKKTDISQMPIAEYTLRINKIRKYIMLDHLIAGPLLIVIYFMAFGLDITKILIATAFAMACILIMLRSFLKRLRRISANLRELEELN